MANPKRPKDTNQKAKFIVDLVTGEEEKPEPGTVIVVAGIKKAVKEKNPAAVALGKLGGLKGGKARAKKLSAKRRSEIAKKAAKKRWGNKS